MTGIGEARSLLFVPGTRADRYDRMVDLPVITRARRILARATRTANSTTANGTT